jgi:hypothetical protein
MTRRCGASFIFRTCNTDATLHKRSTADQHVSQVILTRRFLMQHSINTPQPTRLPPLRSLGEPTMRTPAAGASDLPENGVHDPAQHVGSTINAKVDETLGRGVAGSTGKPDASTAEAAHQATRQGTAQESFLTRRRQRQTHGDDRQARRAKHPRVEASC